MDIGANAGFFSYQFSLLGAKVDALEPSKKYYDLGVIVSQYYKAKVRWFPTPLTKKFLKNKHYDVALMLSVFQWISQGNKQLHPACNLLKEVSKRADYLIFELGCNRGASAIQVTGSLLLIFIFWIYSFLKENTDYQSVYFLGFTYPHVRITRPWGYLFPRALFIVSSKEVHLSLIQKILFGLFHFMND